MVRMIVNADDFGFFDEVSRGILDAAAQGRVTATGVMANGPALERWADALVRTPGLDAGVHLNASLGRPLSRAMTEALDASGGEFIGKGAMAAAVLRKQIGVDVVIGEWRAQIEHCRALGITPVFVNSHEHLHMLPSLYPRVRELAASFGISHVRAPAPEWGPTWSLGGLARSGVFAALRLMTVSAPDTARLIGVDPSGHLSVEYCRWRFKRLSAGRMYELMCHPGHVDAEARKDPKLAAYHDWEGELATLLSDEFTELLTRHGIRLLSYSATAH